MRFVVCSLLTLSCFGANFSATNEPRALAFEARNEQYVSHGPGYVLSVTSGGAVLSLGGHVVRMSAAGASPKSSLEALDRMQGRANYFLGRDVRASYDLYGRVRWRGVYSGIDLVFRGNQEHLEYDFEIGAERDPGRIRLAFDGIDDIQIDPNRDLVLRVGAAQIHQPKPVAYQIVAGKRQAVDVAYWIDASSHVRFRTGAYDRERPLVIDPQIVFDKSFGGSSESSAAGLARDTQGNLYVAGTTNSSDFLTLNAAQSHPGAAPLLISADGGQTWTTPTLGAADTARSIAYAPSSPSILYAATNTGVIRSTDAGTTWITPSNAGLVAPPIAVAVDAGSASTVYAATYSQGIFTSTNGGATWNTSTNGLIVPGSIPPSLPELSGLVADPAHTGTVFAIAQSPDFVYRSTDYGKTWTQASFPPGGSPIALVFSPTNPKALYLGQRTGAFLGFLDGGNTWTNVSNEVVRTSQGLAISPGNPSILYGVSNGGVDRSSDGGQTWTTVLPISSKVLQGNESVAVDPKNSSMVYALDSSGLYRSTDAGKTWKKTALPYVEAIVSLFVSAADSRLFVGEGSQTDAFVTKWSPDGSQVLYSTYLGGSGGDGASGIAVDEKGSVYVTGFTSSPDFPTTSGAYQTKFNGTEEVFVAKLSPDGSQLVYSTLIGSGSAGSIAVDNTGSAVIIGSTQGNFPVTPNAFQTAPVASCNLQPTFFNIMTSGDAFVTRITAGGNSLLYSTLLGGSCATYGTNVAVDASGNAWVAGSTTSPDFPVTSDALQPQFGGGYYDGFLARFNPSGGLDYATYVGGPGYDALKAIAFDPSGNIYLTGESGGLSQPASPGAFQPQASASCYVVSIGPAAFSAQGNALVLKLDSAAHSIQRLTYLGAPLCLSPSSIAVDSSGEPWISGTLNQAGSAPQTASPFAIGIGQGFISKFSADFSQLLFSTYFDSVAGLALDSSGLAFVAGTGAQKNATGTQIVYIAKIDATPPAISLDSVMSVVLSPDLSNSRGIAAGEVIRILGKHMGPATVTPGAINSGGLASTVAGVQVTFDGTAVPLLSVSAQEIDLVAPFELATKSTTTIQVQYNGVKSNPVQVAVTGAALQILGVFNEDFSTNSASNPAQAGSVMILYLAGAGQTNPPSQDGQVNAAPLAAPGMPILCFANIPS